MMKGNVNVQVRRTFRINTKEVVRDLEGNAIAEIWITRGTDGNKIEIVVLDPKLEVKVRDATVQ